MGAQEFDAWQLTPEHAPWSPEDLAKNIAARHGASIEEIRGPRRHPHLLAARRELYLALRERGWSYPVIGRFVRRDHTTVLKALRPKKRTAKAVVVELTTGVRPALHRAVAADVDSKAACG